VTVKYATLSEKNIRTYTTIRANAASFVQNRCRVHDSGVVDFCHEETRPNSKLASETTVLVTRHLQYALPKRLVA